MRGEERERRLRRKMKALKKGRDGQKKGGTRKWYRRVREVGNKSKDDKR